MTAPGGKLAPLLARSGYWRAGSRYLCRCLCLKTKGAKACEGQKSVLAGGQSVLVSAVVLKNERGRQPQPARRPAPDGQPVAAWRGNNDSSLGQAGAAAGAKSVLAGGQSVLVSVLVLKDEMRQGLRGARIGTCRRAVGTPVGVLALRRNRRPALSGQS